MTAFPPWHGWFIACLWIAPRCFHCSLFDAEGFGNVNQRRRPAYVETYPMFDPSRRFAVCSNGARAVSANQFDSTGPFAARPSPPG
jgi:hypothetical protein